MSDTLNRRPATLLMALVAFLTSIWALRLALDDEGLAAHGELAAGAGGNRDRLATGRRVGGVDPEGREAAATAPWNAVIRCACP
jgi:hypothetical protein